MHEQGDSDQALRDCVERLRGTWLFDRGSAIDLEMLDFVVAEPREKINGKGETIEVGDYALHLQCGWRLTAPSGIVTGRSDVLEPDSEPAAFDYDEWDDVSNPPSRRNRRMNDFLAETSRDDRMVRSVRYLGFGAFAVAFPRHELIVLPSGTTTEDWRIFRPADDGAHTVCFAGGYARTTNDGVG